MLGLSRQVLLILSLAALCPAFQSKPTDRGVSRAAYNAPKQSQSRQYAPAYTAPAPAYAPAYMAPAPVYAPSYTAPQPAYAPAYTAPAPAYAPKRPCPLKYNAPAYEAPAYVTPTYATPAYAAPVYSPPVYEVPVYEAPAPVYTPQYYRPICLILKLRVPLCPQPYYQEQLPAYNPPQPPAYSPPPPPAYSPPPPQAYSPPPTPAYSPPPTPAYSPPPTPAYSPPPPPAYSPPPTPAYPQNAVYSSGPCPPPAQSYGQSPSSYGSNSYANSYGNFVPINRFNHVIRPSIGQYDVEFEAGNGIRQQETGYMKSVQNGYGQGGVANVKQGCVSWVSPEGIPFSFSYTADENGYRAVGAHIPGPQ